MPILCFTMESEPKQARRCACSAALEQVWRFVTNAGTGSAFMETKERKKMRKFVSVFAALGLMLSMMVVLTGNVGANQGADQGLGHRVETIVIDTDVDTQEQSFRQDCQIGSSGQTGTQSVEQERTVTTTTYQRTVYAGQSNVILDQSTYTETVYGEWTTVSTGPCNAGQG
jgi:ABC-type lipoprotein release transport system permease subunit